MGEAEWLSVKSGVVLAAFENAVFETESVMLGYGDGLLLYTDGVTEAFDPSENLYSTERLLELIRHNPYRDPETLVPRVFQSVKDFAAGAAQADDITVLGVRFKGP